MDSKLFARIGAGVFVAIAVTAAAVEYTRDPNPPERTVAQPAAVGTDPLKAELLRCQQLGEGGPRDPGCLRAWSENRRRFLAPGARPTDRLPYAAEANLTQSGTEP